MVSKSDYARDEVEVCKSVLIELVNILGEFKDSMVLVGGGVPPFLYPGRKDYVGTTDIDLALDHLTVTDETYRRYRCLLPVPPYSPERKSTSIRVGREGA